MLGGLGNQLFQFMFGRYVSEFGKYELILDCSHPSLRLSERGLPELYDLGLIESDKLKMRKMGKFSKKVRNFAIRTSGGDANMSAFKILLSTVVLQATLNRQDSCSGEDLRIRISKDLSGNAMAAELTSLSEYFIGYFQSNKYWVEVLGMDKDTTTGLNDFVEKSYGLWKRYRPHSSALLHIRRGDYKNAGFGLLSADYYRHALKKLNSMRQVDQVYAISDENPEKLSDFIGQIDNDIQIIPTSFYSSTEVLGLISQFAFLVGANSSLSWWGSSLGNLAYGHQGFFPRPWFEKQTSPPYIEQSYWRTVTGDIWEARS